MSVFGLGDGVVEGMEEEEEEASVDALSGSDASPTSASTTTVNRKIAQSLQEYQLRGAPVVCMTHCDDVSISNKNKDGDNYTT